MSNEQKLTSAQQVEVVLSTVDDPQVQAEIRNSYFLQNPIEFARVLHSFELSDSVKREILMLKVSQKPAYKGENLEPLIEASFKKFWAELGARS